MRLPILGLNPANHIKCLASDNEAVSVDGRTRDKNTIACREVFTR
jgi:hypothetical protein